MDSGQEPAAANPVLDAPVPAGMYRGAVLETMNASGYTYVFIGTDQEKRWVAVPQVAINVGDIVQVHPGAPMADFESKSLNRRFEMIYFLGGLENLSAPSALADGYSSDALPLGHPSTDADVTAASADITVVELKEGQNVAYVYANRDALAGQHISLRGKVVKYNSSILGWNFIHIQDGSGDVADGSNDLTVTSKSEAAVGDTIVLTGTIILNKDFGAGYSFPVLMEDASIAAE